MPRATRSAASRCAASSTSPPKWTTPSRVCTAMSSALRFFSATKAALTLPVTSASEAYSPADCAGACASAAGPAAIDIWAIAAAPRVQAASRVRSFIPLCSFVSGPRGRQGRTTATSSLAPEGAAQERDHRKHDEDEEQYLGNRGRPGCDPAEAEHGGDQGDDEE